MNDLSKRKKKNMTNPLERFLNIVKMLISKGLTIIPLKYGEKTPIHKDWTSQKISAENYKEYFGKQICNVGVLLGETIDVDCDWPEARNLARYFLPRTTAVFGRASNPHSHFLYKPNRHVKTKKYQFGSDKGGMVVELRGEGAQTMIPPSIHPSGEPVEFCFNDWKVDEVDAADIERQVCILACAAVVLRHYPQEGCRNSLALALAGFLLRANLSAEETAHFITTVAVVAGDEEAKVRAACVSTTQAKLQANDEVTGLPTLKELLGEPTATALGKWLKSETDAHEGEKTIDELNNNYGFLLVGGKGVILKEVEKSSGFELIGLDAFLNYYDNKIIQFGNGAKAKIVKAAKYWLSHRRRRTFDGLVFEPGKSKVIDGSYNLWSGFAVKPISGDCSKFLVHLKDNICGGNETYSRWLLAWMASIAQDLTRKNGTSVVIRGKQGTGKTIFVQYFGSLFGKHYIVAADPRFITGRFNSHLASCILLHAEEGFWAGDKQAEGKLKDLITGDKFFIEFKGKEPVCVPNYVRLIITGNPRWVVPAGLEERRFAVFEIGDAQMQNKAYFSALNYEMENGGREALLDHLLKLDICDVDLRTIPVTDALLEQKIAGLGTVEKWWLDTLMMGELKTTDCDWQLYELKVGCRLIFESYAAHCNKTGSRFRSLETEVGMVLKRLVPNLQKTRGTYSFLDHKGEMDTRTGSVYWFPKLDDCRAAFEATMGQKIEWPLHDREGSQ